MMVYEWIYLHTGFIMPDWFFGWQGTFTLFMLLMGVGFWAMWVLSGWENEEGENDKGCEL